MKQIKITELLGDGIGPELEQSIDKLSSALPLNLDFEKVDWSLEARNDASKNVMERGISSLKRNQVALKYPTITRGISPNAVLRRRCNFSVIYRPAKSMPGIKSNFKKDINLHIVRVATGGTYEDPGQLVGKHAAVSLRMVEKEPCEHAATFAFELARRLSSHVTSASKHTIQRVTDGLFEDVVKEVHERFPFIQHKVELFDALLAKIIISPQDYRVVLVLNEYGDFLSDMASGLMGSLGTAASGNYAFNHDSSVALAMFDPAGGTAPDIAGKNVCNPAAIFLAFSMMLDHIGRRDLGDQLRYSVTTAVNDGTCTRDLGGALNTDEFTDLIITKMVG